MKIYHFSLFKLLSIPLIILGQIFYLFNFGTYNYFAFTDEIYSTFYSKLACFAYYLPDIFFLISGFLFARKLFRMDEYKEEKMFEMLKIFGRKFLRLYPMYFIVICIYWFVSPALHAGPLWNVYTDQADQCTKTWWRSLLLIDNWW